MTETKRRPAGVTFVVILTWVAAVTDLVTGGAFVWLSLHMSGVDLALTDTELRGYGFALLAAGLLAAAFALGVAAGSQLSRVLVMLLMVGRIAGAVYATSVLGELVRWQVVGQILGSVLIIVALSTPSAFAYFRRS
ncbi:hypothetical protein [Demequina mangrovi]|uniref:Major facilitator superfamily (MFS) profile domain-containing protein n=1 Tax=Demequina mangrovi TaxID=1043493 RepID=A0A1H6ZDV0_9MICO|nr:hypothetical protein [Demequina mangrovi]SEJ49647.1 hypothetical protein SAMN05421637_2016 [Demequina mangrovi]